MNNRRVGTFTLGISLILTGIFSIISLFGDYIDIITILKFSPLILVFLGIEMLVSYGLNNNENLKYDGLSIFISFVLITGTLMTTAFIVFVDHFMRIN